MSPFYAPDGEPWPTVRLWDGMLMPLLSQATTWAPAGGMPTVSQPYGGRMSPSHPADAHGTLPNPGSLPGTVNKSDV